MERTVSLLGHPAVIVDRDESHYLRTLPSHFEADTLAVFSAFCAPHFNALDVGANIGLTAIALGRLCAQGHVFAIEASPDTFPYLYQNVARSGLKNVRCENLAAAATAGEVELSHPEVFSAGAFVSDKYQFAKQALLQHRVRALPMDDYLDGRGVERIDFIKIDVEGFELEVLRGLRRTIERCKPVVFCEVNHWCLNVLHRICLPDFVEEVRSILPHVFAINTDAEVLDLSNPHALHKFYHDHTTQQAFPNLLCGFDHDALQARLAWLPRFYRLERSDVEMEAERVQMRAQFEQEAAALRCEAETLRAERDAIVNSRSWRFAAPLRKLRAWSRGAAPNGQVH